MKKGFTLMELLLVLAILAFLGVSSVILFSKNNDDIESEDLKNKYKEIQDAAILYIDLNDSWLSTFTESGETFIRLGVLQNENYISSKLKNPITGETFPSNYLVKVYIANKGDANKEYVDSCIISNTGEQTRCIANKDGNACGCCNYATTGNTGLNPVCSN